MSSFAGLNEGINFISKELARIPGQALVAVLGDKECLEATLRKNNPDQTEKIRFIYSANGFESDYMFVFANSFQEYDRQAKDPTSLFSKARVVFSYEFDGNLFYKIYKLPVPDYSKPIHIKLEGSPSFTGFSCNKEHLCASPQRNAKGYLLFGKFIRVLPGAYTFTFDATLPANFDIKSLEGFHEVMQYEVGSKCSRKLELTSRSMLPLPPTKFTCYFDRAKLLQLRVHWTGTVPIEFSSIQIQSE